MNKYVIKLHLAKIIYFDNIGINHGIISIIIAL